MSAQPPEWALANADRFADWLIQMHWNRTDFATAQGLVDIVLCPLCGALVTPPAAIDHARVHAEDRFREATR